MSTLVLVLTAAMAVPGNGPDMVSVEIAEQRLNLSGVWKGTIFRQEGKPLDAMLGDSILFDFDDWEYSDEGAGRFSLIVSGAGYLGIYMSDGDDVILCYRRARYGRPESFRAGDGQHLLILHRVKPRK
jgi:hypothetical protein